VKTTPVNPSFQTPSKSVPSGVNPRDIIIQWFANNPHEAVKKVAPEVALMDIGAILSVTKSDWTAATGGNVLAATSITTYLKSYLA